jgi:hypothetical protein
MKGFEGGLKAPHTRFETFGRLLKRPKRRGSSSQHVQVVRKFKVAEKGV